MISFEPNIAIIDDREEEIKGILNYYHKDGIGCKYFFADDVEGDDPPLKPYSDLNLIFLDLYLDGENFHAETCSNWVRQLIPEKTFYILIIWSKDPSEATEVLENLKRLKRLPFIVLEKNKNEYTIEGDEKYDFSKLFENISEEIANIPSLSEIGIWKKSIKNASNLIIGNLTKDIIPTILTNKLKKIIIGHGGKNIQESDDYNRKRVVLFDALDSTLISNTKKTVLTDDISKINIETLYDLKTFDQTTIDTELNSWFHFKLEKDIPHNLILPGLICQNESPFFKKYYSIEDDDKISSKLVNQKSNGAIIEDIVLVLTRPCDIAQSKFGKNINLLSGLIIKNAHRKPNGKLNIDGLPDSIKCFEHLYFDDETDDVTLLFDYRYIFSVPKQVFIDKFKNLKIFNKELLSEMQVGYSSYSSRLGITQII